MPRPTKEKLMEIRSSTVYLLKNTTWKCGKLEKRIVSFLRDRLYRVGIAKATIHEILVAAAARRTGDVYEALRRLQKRKIIAVNV